MLYCGPKPRAAQVRVRELADVFGVDRIDDADGFTLGVHRSFQASTETGDNHFFEFFACLFLREYRVDKDSATNNGEQCLRGYRECLSIEFHSQMSSALVHLFIVKTRINCDQRKQELTLEPGNDESIVRLNGGGSAELADSKGATERRPNGMKTAIRKIRVPLVPQRRICTLCTKVHG